VTSEPAESTDENATNASSDFTPDARFADELIDRADMDRFAEVTRRFARNIGYHHQRYGGGRGL
jgi:hypothetical protein